MNFLKTFFLFVTVLFSTIAFGQEEKYIEFWAKNDAEFADAETSPLKEDALTSFDKQRYQKAGVLHFKIDTSGYELSAYRNLELMRMPGYENQLFVPFTDESNGKGTYEGGRYLELEIPETDSTLVDFNMVNNPYCAYSDKYSCPIPPRENDLKVGIFAGAKSPKGK